MCKHYPGINPKTCQVCTHEHNEQTTKGIDWTKPIRWKSNTQSIYVKHIGAYEVAVADDSNNIFLIGKWSGHRIYEQGGLPDVENIPEPKKEAWVNVYFVKVTGSAYSSGAKYGSKAHANACSHTNSNEVYCGAFQVE